MPQNKKFYELKADLLLKENPNLTPQEMYAMGWKEARGLAQKLLIEIFLQDHDGATERAKILIGGLGESRQYVEQDGKFIRKEF